MTDDALVVFEDSIFRDVT